jgi:hypothetical protein
MLSTSALNGKEYLYNTLYVIANAATQKNNRYQCSLRKSDRARTILVICGNISLDGNIDTIDGITYIIKTTTAIIEKTINILG